MFDIGIEYGIEKVAGPKLQRIGSMLNKATKTPAAQFASGLTGVNKKNVQTAARIFTQPASPSKMKTFHRGGQHVRGKILRGIKAQAQGLKSKLGM
jgi:hypothetical protein